MSTTIRKALATVPLKFRKIFRKYIDLSDDKKPDNQKKYVALIITGFEKDDDGDESAIKAFNLYFNFGDNTIMDGLTVFVFEDELLFNEIGVKVSNLNEAQEKLTAKLNDIRKTADKETAFITEKIPAHIQKEAKRLIKAGATLKSISVHRTYAVLAFAENNQENTYLRLVQEGKREAGQALC